MNQIKLIITDLDNTLLRRDKTISDYTVDVLRRVRRRGILLAFATARDYRFVTEHLTPLFAITPDVIISDNGALARLDGEDIYKQLIPMHTANALLPQFSLVRCVSTENAYYLSSAYADGHWSLGKQSTRITDFQNGVPDDVLYLDGNLGKIASIITEDYPEIRAVSYSDTNSVTMVHREASKLNALKAVECALHLTSSEFAAFGDDYSDIEMLSYCGHRIAMSNAIDEVKAAANDICGDCDEDGVAQWLEKNLL